MLMWGQYGVCTRTFSGTAGASVTALCAQVWLCGVPGPIGDRHRVRGAQRHAHGRAHAHRPPRHRGAAPRILPLSSAWAAPGRSVNPRVLAAQSIPGGPGIPGYVAAGGLSPGALGIPPPPAATRIITMTEAVTAEELASDEEYSDILEDMREECGKARPAPCSHDDLQRLR